MDTSVDFVAPFSIPEHIVTPQKWSKHLKIAHTARKVQQSPHLEVLLRVRQKDNPAFSFLFDDDQLHPYYQFLKVRVCLIRFVRREYTCKNSNTANYLSVFHRKGLQEETVNGQIGHRKTTKTSLCLRTF